MKQLVKGFTNEQLWYKAEHEGLEYLFLDYLDLDEILDSDLRKLAQQFKLAYEEIQTILQDCEPE